MAISIFYPSFVFGGAKLSHGWKLACWPFVEKIWSWSFVISKKLKIPSFSHTGGCSWWVVYPNPIIFLGFYTAQVVVWDFWTINSSPRFKMDAWKTFAFSTWHGRPIFRGKLAVNNFRGFSRISSFIAFPKIGLPCQKENLHQTQPSILRCFCH